MAEVDLPLPYHCVCCEKALTMVMATRMVFARQLALVMTICLFVSVLQCEAYVPNDQDCITCHGKKNLRSRKGKIRFIDPIRFSESSHAKAGTSCTSCHSGITYIDPKAKIPHPKVPDPNCEKCHKQVSRDYSKSLHAKVSKKICYSCHNPHYSISFREMSGDDRQKICLNCHSDTSAHRWLPQKELHFNYLECTSCHALNAEIGMVFFMKDRLNPPGDGLLKYEDLASFIKPGSKDLPGSIDLNRDGRLSQHELQSFMMNLCENGIPGASLEVRILVLRPSHNFTSRGESARNCTLCHSRNAAFYAKLVLEIPDKEGAFRTMPLDKEILAYHGAKQFMGDIYLLGESKISREDLQRVLDAIKRIGFKWIDFLGIFAILLSIAAVSTHGLIMFLTRKLRTKPDITQDRPARPLFISAWHWVHGLCVTILVLTAIQLRLPDMVHIFATFLNAVNLHNLAGVVLILDYFAWFTFSILNKEFRHLFVLPPEGFIKDMAASFRYYGYSIFRGDDYPIKSQRMAIFNFAERVYFCTVMLVFLPIQIFTGILMYDVHFMMPVIKSLGGLRLIDGVHLFCSYLLISSIIVHLYFHMLKKYRFSTLS